MINENREHVIKCIQQKHVSSNKILFLASGKQVYIKTHALMLLSITANYFLMEWKGFVCLRKAGKRKRVDFQRSRSVVSGANKNAKNSPRRAGRISRTVRWAAAPIPAPSTARRAPWSRRCPRTECWNNANNAQSVHAPCWTNENTSSTKSFFEARVTWKISPAAEWVNECDGGGERKTANGDIFRPALAVEEK